MSLNTIHNFHRLSQLADAAVEKALVKSGVTARQAAIVEAIFNSPNGSQQNIIDATGVDRSTLSDIVRRLQKHGLATRKRSKQDGRAYHVNLTTEGQKVASAIMRVGADVTADLAIAAKEYGITVRV